jgi:hypothetical protein
LFLSGSLISVAGGAFLRASAKIGKIQFNLSLPLPSLRSVQGLGCLADSAGVAALHFNQLWSLYEENLNELTASLAVLRNSS